MANVVNTQLLMDGPSNVIIKLTGILDTADITSTVLLDPATLSSMGENLGLANRLVIDKVSYNVESPLAVNLYWDATTPILINSLVNSGDDLEYKRFGGLWNNSGVGITGKISYTTQGWSVGAILSFNIILECRKKV